jgi:PKD repeat protein
VIPRKLRLQELKLMRLSSLFLTLCGLFFVNGLAAQTPAVDDVIHYCGSTEALERLLQERPHVHLHQERDDARLELETQAFMDANRDELIVIPVVFHIVHNNGVENISDEQVHSAMEVINRDFRLLNPDANTIIDEFLDVASDVEIEFRLAQRDPNGNCHSGINRIVSDLTYDGTDDVKDLIQWPRNKYMNVWVVNYAAGAAGWTYTPGSVSNNNSAGVDGIMLKHDYTGEIGTSNTFRSRTFTHEAGHWMNLRHTWGNGNEPGLDSNCDMDDNVDDTPLTLGWVNCNLNGESCGSLDNVQNYMDYSYCGRMFTDGQRIRMRAAMNSSTAQRNQLWTPNNLVATGTDGVDLLCDIQFTSSRRMICAGDSVQFTDESYHGVNAWEWDFGDGAPVSTEPNPWHTFNEPGFYTIKLTASNNNATEEGIQENFIQVLEDNAMDLPYSEGFESGMIPEMEWLVQDETGDGVTWAVTSSASLSGDYSLKMNNFAVNSEMTTDQLISSTMDMSGAAEIHITYSWAYSFKGTNPDEDDTDDRLKVYASSDCGSTWSLRRMHRGFTDLPTADPHPFPFVPSGPEEWTTYTLVLPYAQFLTENFRMLFEFESRMGNNLYLDDINIQAVGVNDIARLAGSGQLPVTMYPNPTSGLATCEFQTGQQHHVVVMVRDLTGRTVANPQQGVLPAGQHQVAWETNGWASGTYLVSVEIDGVPSTQPLVVE